MSLVSTYSAADDVGIRVRADGVVRLAVALTLGMLALRLFMSTRVQLFADESYYWLWAQQLQGAYYDHPPMVALFIKAGTLLFGDTEFGVRFFANVALLLDAILVFGIVRVLTGNLRTAAWATVFFNAAILFGAFGFFMAPDQPMVLFWLAALYGLAKIAKGGPSTWWLWVGAMGGLATMSKLATFFLALSVLLWLVLVPQLRRSFRGPWIYTAALIAVAICTPMLIWNAQHDWVSFTFQASRVSFQSAEPQPWNLGFYLLMVLILATPPTALLAAAGLRIIAARGWRRDPGRALLVLTPLPLALYLAYASLWELTGPHWVAPLLVMMAIWAAYGVERIGKGFWGGVLRVARKTVVPMGVAVTLLFYFGLVETVLPLRANADPFGRFRGGEAWAEEVATIRAETGAAYILTRYYHELSGLRFYLGADTPVFPLYDFDRWSYFGDLGQPAPALASMTGLYVAAGDAPFERYYVSLFFNSVVEVGQAFRANRPGEGETSTIWLVSDPKPETMFLFGLPPQSAAAF